MRKIDVYVARTFVGPFLVCLAGFVGLFVIIDFFAKIDEFAFEESLWRTVRQVAEYYALLIPTFLAQREVILTVVGAVICLLRLERSHETVAIRSSGISARRMSVPVLLCAAGVMVLGVLNQELLVPSLHARLLGVERRVRRESRKRIAQSVVVDRQGRLLLIASYDPAMALPTLKGVRIGWDDTLGAHHEKEATRAFAPAPGPTWYMEDVRESAGRRTLFEGAAWEDKPPEGFYSTAVEQLIERYRKVADRSEVPLITQDKNPVPTMYEFGTYTETEETWPVAERIEIVHPSDPAMNARVERLVWVQGRWLMFGGWRYGRMNPETKKLDGEALPEGQVFESSVRPQDIQGGDFRKVSGMMTLGELSDLASRFPSPRFRQRCWVTIWNRVLLAFGNILLVLFVLPVAFRQATRGAGLAVSLALLVLMGYLVANLISVDLGNSGWFLWRSALWAAAFPTLVFGAVGVWLFAGMDEV